MNQTPFFLLAYLIIWVAILYIPATPLPFILFMLLHVGALWIFNSRCPQCKLLFVFEFSGATEPILDKPGTYRGRWECRSCQHSLWREYKPSSGGAGGGGGSGGGGGGCGGGGGGC